MQRSDLFPEQYIRTNFIEKMEVGQSGFVVPWALSVTLDQKMFLNGHYTYEPWLRGTSCMLVTRTSKGYQVDIRQVDERYRWELRDEDDIPSEAIPVHIIISG